MFRSKKSVYGPWEEQGQSLWYNGPDEEVQRTGHADVFEDGKGRWWAVLLGVRPGRKRDGQWLEPQLGKCKSKPESWTYRLTIAGRETFLVTVDWVDDWPIFNHGKNIALLTQGRDSQHTVSNHLEEIQIWRADLSRTELELGWYQKSMSSCCFTATAPAAY